MLYKTTRRDVIYHGFFMSEKFNEKGINSVCLTSEDSIQKREETIKKGGRGSQ